MKPGVGNYIAVAALVAVAAVTVFAGKAASGRLPAPGSTVELAETFLGPSWEDYERISYYVVTGDQAGLVEMAREGRCIVVDAGSKGTVSLGVPGAVKVSIKRKKTTIQGWVNSSAIR